ncbi:unnamed protein product [Auanema sp. JU1783]|nr:unnamed protein product [Auanema sp. JU1783]
MSSNHYDPVVKTGGTINDFFLSCYFAWNNFWSLLTGKSHLERILEQQGTHRASLISHVEWFLLKAGCVMIESLPRADPEDIFVRCAVSAQGEHRSALKFRLSRYLSEMKTYNKLRDNVEDRRREVFNPKNDEHVDKLKKLWELTLPDRIDEFALVSKVWQEIGYQGVDPSTDFRGMGMLSLDQLLYLGENYPEQLKAIHQISHHPTIGFPMAVAGITITSFCHHMLRKGVLRKHFYNLSASHRIDFIAYNNAYCRIFTLFCEYYKRSNPKSIMSFNEYRLKFEKAVHEFLDLDGADLSLLTVDTLCT